MNHIDYLVTIAKENYLREKTRLPNTAIHNELIKVIMQFDRDSDKSIADSLLRGEAVVDIESFFAFKCDPLKTRWNEMVELINENKALLICEGTANNLLDFLKENLEDAL